MSFDLEAMDGRSHSFNPHLDRSVEVHMTSVGFFRNCAILFFFGVLSFIGPVLAQSGSAIEVYDSALGGVCCTLTLPAGWQGRAQLDHTSDALLLGVAALSADASSGDGKFRYVALPIAFHTYTPEARLISGASGARNAAFVRFTSSQDILIRHVLPMLGLGDRPDRVVSDRREVPQRMGQPPGLIVDSAMALFTRAGSDTVIHVETNGSRAGTPQEITTSFITIATAPAGQGIAAMRQLANYFDPKPSQQWMQANSQYLAQWRNRRVAQSNAAVQQMQATTNAVLANARHTQQASSDAAALAAGTVGDKDVYYNWCSATGEKITTVNKITPPGPGYARCD
ncbi:MAG TPA: hypothetical protein VGC30_08925 [Dokdonella sp.]